MRKGRILWAPYPFKAGFCITDDADSATLEQVRLVHDFLVEMGLPTTRAVWVFEPRERCGVPPIPDSILRGVTLEDRSYFDYCRYLYERGYEICLHGASAGNNERERVLRAFEIMETHFGDPGTYICHAKNAENPYWEAKVTSIPILGRILGMYSRQKCYGEVEGSRYFWGDICRAHVRQMRLYRTRSIDTLSANPSMPYFDGRKPYVNSWFSATKRSFMDCTTERALNRLKRDHGLIVLYQYLHRYADPESAGVDERFERAVKRLVSDREIYLGTVGDVMSRLRLIQGLFLVYSGREFWLANANNDVVEGVQIRLPEECHCTNGFPKKGATLVLEKMEPGAIVRIGLDRDAAFCGRNVKRLARDGRARIRFCYGDLYLNLSNNEWRVRRGLSVGPGSFHLDHELGIGKNVPMSKMGLWEEMRLIAGQVLIVGREVVLKGRSFASNRFLDRGKIPLENHDEW